MRVSLPAVFNQAHRLHEPGGEIWVGVRTPGTELPERAERIRTALLEAGAHGVEAEAHGDEAVDAVHEPALLDYLAGAWEEWERAGLTEDPGQDRVVPYIVCHPGMTDGFAPTRPAAASARAGFFAYDTMTLIGPGTWQAARGAIDTALTAVDLVAAGEPPAYACCRPRATTQPRPASAAPATSTTLRRPPAACAPGSVPRWPCWTSTPTTAMEPSRSSMRIRRSSPARFTSIRAPGGSPTFSASSARPAPGPLRDQPQPLPRPGRR